MPQYASIMPEYALMSLSMPEHGWMLLNVPEYCLQMLNFPEHTCKCLSKLFWLCQDSEYASSSEIFDRVLKMPKALKMQGFWICSDIVIIALLLL